MDYYGTFLENTELSTAVVDQDENVYVFQRTSPVSLVKITPEGERIMLNEDVSSAATDAKIGPDGSMVVLVNNRQTSKINLETGEETDWLRLSKSVSRGDFDENGNLYAGGRRSDLIVILPDESFSQIGHWIADEILWVRVYDNYVYLLIDIASVSEERPDFSIWRHPIDGAGNVGEPELFIDWTQTGDYAESLPSCFTFSENGLMMIGTDHADPIMLYDLESDTQDILYKDILPTAAIQLVWGAGSHVYMILGGENNNLIRIDMGTAGAPYYGR